MPGNEGSQYDKVSTFILSLCVSALLYLSICLSLSIYPYIYLSIYICIYTSIYPSIHLSICKYIYTSIYQSIYLSICKYIYTSIYLSISISIYLSTQEERMRINGWERKEERTLFPNCTYIETHDTRDDTRDDRVVREKQFSYLNN